MYKHHTMEEIINTCTKKDMYSSGLQQQLFSILSYLHTHDLEMLNEKINEVAYRQMNNFQKRILKLFWKVRITLML